jgi:hypothetical protein
MGFCGHVDMCTQSHVAGWAANGRGDPVPVTIRLNGRVLATAIRKILRPDLVAHGISPECGFSVIFEEPLTIIDEVTVVLPNGDDLIGSPCKSHQVRLREVLHGITPEMRGFEVGPLDRPILPKSKYRVLYVDHASRENLIVKYQSSATPDTLASEQIVPIDIVWAPGKTLRNCMPEAAVYDYCLASHVIEHVADPISWLQQIASVLKDSAILSMAVPDKERTFDHLRMVTRPADLIDAYVRLIPRPSPCHVFDHITSVSQINVEPQPTAPRLIREAFAHAIAVHHTETYLDVHCHVFTPKSFLQVFETIAHTGVLPFKLSRFYTTRNGANEFIVSLKKCSANPEEIAESYAAAIKSL